MLVLLPFLLFELHGVKQEVFGVMNVVLDIEVCQNCKNRSYDVVGGLEFEEVVYL